MSKGARRRPTEIAEEEDQLRWVLAFAKTDEARRKAKEALEEYLERKKSSYIEKRI